MPPLGCPVCRSAAGYYLSLQSSADGPGGPLAGEESLGEPQLAVRASLAAEAEQAARETADRLRAAVGRLSWPARTTAAVSASPRLQAGVPVSSVGIAGTPAGWEVYAGGFDELPVRQAELIGFALSAEQALEFAFACLEWYRDTAYWGGPVWKWLERTGLTAVRERLLDAGIRGELSLRLEGRLRKWENADSSGDGSGPEDGAALSERSVVPEA
jgi:nitrite reductase (NADH) large subunit